jgi:hypothetical protein
MQVSILTVSTLCNLVQPRNWTPSQTIMALDPTAAPAALFYRRAGDEEFGQHIHVSAIRAPATE